MLIYVDLIYKKLEMHLIRKASRIEVICNLIEAICDYGIIYERKEIYAKNNNAR